MCPSGNAGGRGNFFRFPWGTNTPATIGGLHLVQFVLYQDWDGTTHYSGYGGEAIAAAKPQMPNPDVNGLEGPKAELFGPAHVGGLVHPP